ALRGRPDDRADDAVRLHVRHQHLLFLARDYGLHGRDRRAGDAVQRRGVVQIALNLTRSFTPFMGAALLSWHAIGLGGSYVVVAIIMVPTLASIALIPRAANAPLGRAPRGSMLGDMRLGLQHV